MVAVTQSHKKHVLNMAIKNPHFEVLGEYVGCKTRILYKCKKCQEVVNRVPNDMLKGRPCKCLQRKSHDSYIQDVADVNKNIIVVGKYTTAQMNIEFNCAKCAHDWVARPDSILAGQGCPKCNNTNYSKVAIDWLNSLNNSNIQHAENDKEKCILAENNKRMFVDGFDPETNTVYEFLL